MPLPCLRRLLGRPLIMIGMQLTSFLSHRLPSGHLLRTLRSCPTALLLAVWGQRLLQDRTCPKAMLSMRETGKTGPGVYLDVCAPQCWEEKIKAQRECHVGGRRYCMLTPTRPDRDLTYVRGPEDIFVAVGLCFSSSDSWQEHL